jgi:prevent-host-death family protein
MKTELVTTLKRQATRVLSDLHDTGEPVLITEHGRPSAYLVDVNAYELMQSRMSILEGIARGERSIFERRTYTQEEAKRKMQKWLS